MKFVLIGAGSAFGRRLSVDILSREMFADSTIALCDIDAQKLDIVVKYVRKVIQGNNLPATLISGTDRAELLKDADFVVLSISVGGPAYYDEPYESEIKIPLKYGLHQTVGDTIGPGGIFRALRTAPVMMRILQDVAALAPNALVLNYTNPMAILTRVMNGCTDLPVVGLCHSVQGTGKKLAGYLDVPHEALDCWVAGINHMSWFLTLTHAGRDAYPRLRERMSDADIYAQDPVRFDILRDFGYFVTESSRHMGEYVPWFQHEPEVLDQFDPLYKLVPEARKALFADMGIKIEQVESIELVRSHEYASGIMEAMTTHTPMRFNGNVLNKGLIANLPPDCCVEVPCLVDRDGVHPCAVGALPEPCAALCRTNVNVQELAAYAIRERDREAAFQALALDPCVGATMTLKQTRRMFKELWRAEGDLLAHYGNAQ